MHLVVGATGLVGHSVAIALANSGEQVRAFTRRSDDDARVSALRAAGAEIARGDLKDPPSVAAACRGIRVVVTTASSTISTQAGDSIETVDRVGQLGLVDAARAAGVQRFVFVSFSGNLDLDFPLRNAKREVEARVRSSGIQYTILRPTMFMEVWLSPMLGFDAAAGRARIYGEGHNPISWISLHDVVRYTVAAACGHEAAWNASVELGGPAAVSPLDVVRTFERASGRTFEVEHVPEQGLRAQFESAADPTQKSFAALMLGYAAGDAIPMAETAKRFGIQPTSIEDFARTASGGTA
jgi:uncharacterized protein YbjT (DUF2867 family)